MTGPSLRIAAACLALSLLGGCASYSTGSNKGQRSGGGASYNAGSGAYSVERGDTVYAISRRFDISVRTLIDVNKLQPPYVLYPGQKLTLPASQNGYVVEKGDTLWAVSRKTGVSFTALAQMNNLEEPYHLKVGQRLNVAGGRSGSAASGGGASGVTVIRSSQSGGSSDSQDNFSAPMTASSNSGGSGAGRPVDSYQAGSGGASQSGDSYRPLTQRSDEPVLGQREAPAAIAAAAQASQDGQKNPIPSTVSAPSNAVSDSSNAGQTGGSSAIAPAVASAPAQVVLPKPLPDPPRAAGGGYLWPAKGPVIATFGVTGKGQHNDGINIKLPKGTPVFAAENGVVAYAGNEIRGFGNLLLIKHASGWMTAYAHNDQLLVERGAIVKKGQKIALSGDSGGANPPQLHFEVRKGSRAVDPMTVLGSRTGSSASAGGRQGPG